MTQRLFSDRKCRQALVLLSIGTLLSNLPTHAQVLTPVAYAWYNDTGSNNQGVGNYIAGFRPASGPNPATTYHDYFTFDLSGISGSNVAGATLDLYQPTLDPNDPLHTGNGLSGPLTFSLGAVSTAPTLVDTSFGVPIFDDLAGGAVYGSYALTPAGDGTTLHLSLNAAAVAAINSHAGGLFTLGGYVPANDGYTFAFTSNGTLPGGSAKSPTPTLTLTPGAVPEASTTASFGLLLALGMGGLVLAAGRRRADKKAAPSL